MKPNIMLLFLIFFAITSIFCAYDNSTLDRKRKNLGIFNVVQFENEPCTGTNNLNGTCYTESECSDRSGTSSGSCASGFGVCCTFSLACGGKASENATYAIMTSYSTSTNADPCIYTICKMNSDICKLRIDFESMTLSDPEDFDTSATLATGVLLALEAGQCQKDTLTVTNPDGKAPPVICGVNTGQHMFVSASDQCNQIKVDIDTGTSTTRSWQIKVTQYECSSPNIPVEDCLQYHTGTSGTFYSFGWDKSVTTVTSTSHIHLQNQYYDICFRRERGYCSLCFTPQIFKVTPSPNSFTSFGVSAAGAGPGTSAIGLLCGMTSATAINPATQDYIEVKNLQPSTGTTKTAGTSRICGTVFNANPTAAAQAAASPSSASTACTWSTPFKWGVRFNGEEIAIATPASATAQNTYEHYIAGTTGAGVGYSGFYMNFWQNSC